jgi:hypothetical protein
MTSVASFHLVLERPGRQLLAMARLGADRPHLAHVPGLIFWRLLGTGKGSDTGLGADLRRTALFAVWRSPADLDRFLAEDPIALRWRRAQETYTISLLGGGGHGTWRGFDVAAALQGADTTSGPVAVLTRAVVRPSAWRGFMRAARSVSTEVNRAEGLLAACGIGEAPLGRQATFSLWESRAAAHSFAYGEPEHRSVVRRTRAEHWYGEEMFAWFVPYASSGTWDGRDPLRT